MYYTAEQAYTFSTFNKEYLRPKHKMSNVANSEVVVVCLFYLTEISVACSFFYVWGQSGRQDYRVCARVYTTFAALHRLIDWLLDWSMGRRRQKQREPIIIQRIAISLSNSTKTTREDITVISSQGVPDLPFLIFLYTKCQFFLGQPYFPVQSCIHVNYKQIDSQLCSFIASHHALRTAHSDCCVYDSQKKSTDYFRDWICKPQYPLKDPIFFPTGSRDCSFIVLISICSGCTQETVVVPNS